MQVPALADDCDGRGLGGHQRLHAGIILGGEVAPPGHSEGRDTGMAQVEVADRAEVRGVLGVREWIAPLDVVDPQLIEPLGDQQLVLEREIDPLTLAPIA